jgi:hypothetical protein
MIRPRLRTAAIDRQVLRWFAAFASGVGCALMLACRAISPAPIGEVPAPYRSTDHEPGHALVKTAQFLVPVGGVVRIPGLEFTSPDCRLTERHELLLRQAFNALEEITENTVNDADSTRVRRHRAMRFDVRAHATIAASAREQRRVATDCATAVMATFVEAGTPPWRLRALGRAGLPPDAVPSTASHRVPVDLGVLM